MKFMAALKIESHDVKVDPKTEIIEAEFWGGKLENYRTSVDLKAFYNDLHDAFLYNKKGKFKDMVGTGDEKKWGHFFNYQAKAGEHIDNERYYNRTGDIFEKKFVWNVQPSGNSEFELIWEAYFPLPFTGYAWVEFKIDLVCRVMVDKEILVGNEKKKVQDGTWEHRHRIKYKNTIIPEYIAKIPIVGKSPSLRKLVLEHLYLKRIEEEITYVEHQIAPIVKNVVTKHFSPS